MARVKFYPNGSAAPAVLPEFMLAVPKGAWAMETELDCLEMARQLRANGIECRTVRRNGGWVASK